MATTAVEVYGLARAKRYIRIPATLTEHDQLVRDLIAESIAFIETETNLPMIDRSEVYASPGATGEEALLIQVRHVLSVQEVRYWTEAADPSAAPDAEILAAALGRVVPGIYGVLIHPPSTGWPIRHAGTGFQVELMRGLGFPAWPEDAGGGEDQAAVSHRYHVLRGAVAPLARRLYDNEPTFPEQDPTMQLIRKHKEHTFSFGNRPQRVLS